MKTISIGDVHGSDLWKGVRPDDADKIIFVGDYSDSFHHTDNQIADNLLDIIAFKKGYPDKVVLLWGNHDIQYLFDYKHHGCSGYRESMYSFMHSTFLDNVELFQIAHQIENTVWTHAGIHRGWWDMRFHGNREDDIATQLQDAFNRYDETLFDVGHRRGGYYDVGGPLWADKSEIFSNPASICDQIIGHSKVEGIVTVQKNGRTVIAIDNQDKYGMQFLTKTFE
jgi:hypothetical protein